MSDAHAVAVERAYTELSELECTAGSADGLVEVTVGAHGDLRAVHLDPRVGRSRDAGALAAHVLTAAAGAAALVAPRAARVASALLPPHVDAAEADLVFDPLLHELDRLLAVPGPGRRPADPGSDPMPVLDAGIDYLALRQRVSEQRDRASDATATATSDDGLIEATADVRGRLVGLHLNPRVFRAGDSRLLAQRITAAAHRAAALVREGTW